MESEFFRHAFGTAVAYLIVMGAWALIKSIYLTLERRSEEKSRRAGRQERL